MKSYEHSEFEHERAAFSQLKEQVPERSDLELYPSVYISDQSRNVYHECDLLVIAENFAAVVELKHWQGDVHVSDNLWWRAGRATRDPHEVNLPKAKVFKSLLEKALPATRVPFVQSIVVLTASSAIVTGANSAFDTIKRLDTTGRVLGDHLTFDGVDEFAKYLRERVKRDAASGRRQLTPKEFLNLKKKLDIRFSGGPKREDYADQISGFKIIKDIEHTKRYVSYLAEASPARGEMLYRLRVFGPASKDPAVQARQFRSLDTLEQLPQHPNIRPAHRHPNERNLVVEVCPWSDVQTLDQILKAGVGLSLHFAVKVARDIALALTHIHAGERLIHRNLTPRSVIVGRDDHVELTDFDLTFDADSDHTVFDEDEDVDELEREYLAPEALVGKPDLSSDIFSLGCLLNELLKASDGSSHALAELQGLSETMSSQVPQNRPTAGFVADQLSKFLGESRATTAVVEEHPTPRDPQVGDEHETWELVRELGRGGTSWVFYGESHGFPAAIKIFASDVPRDRCLAERDYLNQVRSPFVVGSRGSLLLWAGVYWCIVQDYAEGTSLATLIARKERPGVDLFAEVARQMLIALESLHNGCSGGDEGFYTNEIIIHNDVTPGNIIVDEKKGVAKLIDLGVASNPGLTLIRGTPGYVAQDLVTKEGYLASPQGDLYALAVTLVEWATGMRPEDSESVPPLFPEVLQPEASHRLGGVMRKAMGESVQRFADAQLMREALNTALEGPVENAYEAAMSIAGPEWTDEAAGGLLPADHGSEAQAFVEYLNTTHNVSADNRHALAESQATSRYFQDLHVQLELTKSIEAVLADEQDVVIMLTGHAGDGKSTVAIDLLRRALGVGSGVKLSHSPKEVEKVDLNGRPLAIVKDMSELSASDRLTRLREGMEDKGSAVIVSNTGPLLSTFTEYFSQQRTKHQVEQDVLRGLSQPLINGALGRENSFPGIHGKKVYIANLSMLDNVNVAVELLGKMVDHPAWEACGDCRASVRCPIRQNVELLREARTVTFKRVRYVYERLTAYGRRMTMRQLSGHMSFSLTGGRSCQEVVTQAAAEGPRAFFSESFFGYVGERTAQAEDALFCLRQMADLHFGAASAPTLDQLVQDGKLAEALEMPLSVDGEVRRRQQEARHAAGGEVRRRLRRLAYMFGKPRASYEALERVLIDEFLHSPMLRTLAQWVEVGGVDAGLVKRKFIKMTVGVLMEEYIGCMVPEGKRERLFITLRRPDERVFQSVQIILNSVPVEEFDLAFDRERALPILSHDSARLELTLPLLDYIESRSRGELTNELDAIHRASLEEFRGQLLAKKSVGQNSIKVLQINAAGEVETHTFSVEGNGQKLVYQ
ncbi:NERD domain-containing protein kinase family protein [Thioalkalivibrio sp. ALJ1]|uniref:NERD domain-containing protein kinase family protein n=1 Tax=Thioalkalivibrio sp. ALJ1 TaxID=1158144 RepID=UPI00056E0006|nr:NERD domain-containing protein kinase family protein [Thioalkalivibrio sp. ALJ1]